MNESERTEEQQRAYKRWVEREARANKKPRKYDWVFNPFSGRRERVEHVPEWFEVLGFVVAFGALGLALFAR